MDREQLEIDLILDEGLRLKPYLDTVGKISIGIGRNLDDRGISEREALMLLEGDITIAMADLDRNVPWWRDLPEPAARALTNMCFNLGWPRLSEFAVMLIALEAGECRQAAAAALDSRWARQVGHRAERIAELYRSA
jgi:lysozyme